MKHLRIAYSFDVQYYFVDSDRDIVPIEETDFTDVAVAVLSDEDFDYIDAIEETGFGIPIMVIMPGGDKLPESYIDKVDVVFTEEMVNKSRCIAAAERLAGRYEQTVLPPFLPTSSTTSVKRIRLLTARVTKTAYFLKSILPAGISTIFTDPIFFSPIFVMPTSP